MKMFPKAIGRFLTLGVKKAVYNIRGPKKQPRNCYLLHLPKNIIDQILNFLPHYQQLILCQTSALLRRKLYHLFTPDLSKHDALEFLACLARSRSNRWVCEACVKLHPVRMRDTPSRPNARISCPLSKYEHRLKCGDYGFMDWMVSHRHIQLALKLSRLGTILHPFQKIYLLSLLSHYTCHFAPSRNPCNTACVQAVIESKVKQGRFLVRTTYLYDMGALDHDINKLGKLRICRHQFFDMKPGWRNRPMSQLALLIEEAFQKREDFKLYSACKWCLTDMFVERTGGALLIITASDLGGEGSPLDPEWRTQAFPYGRREERACLDHKIGSIHDLFGHRQKWWRFSYYAPPPTTYAEYVNYPVIVVC